MLRIPKISISKKTLNYKGILIGDIMWQKDHRKSKKACVPRKKFEEEPEYYSFNDNYDYGDVDYEQDNE